MPPRPLPNNPSLERLRKIAKRLCASAAAGEPEAIALIGEFHPHAQSARSPLSLADAQLVVARSHGFPSWAKLKQHIADIEPHVWHAPPPPDPRAPADVFIRLACLTYTGLHPSPARAGRMLAEHPELVRASIYTAAAAGDVDAVAAALDEEPGLLTRKGGPLQWDPLLYACYSRIASADRRHSTLEVARLLLSRSADPNAGFLYDGSYAFTALTGAFGRGEDWPNQPPHPECAALARLLLEAGADPNDAQTIYNRHFRPDDEHFRILFEYGLGRDHGGPWIARLNDPLFNPASLLVVELCAAVQHGFFDRVRLLVEHDVDVNGRSRRTGRTPYEEALRAGRASIATYLLEHGASMVALDPLETFALACIAGRRDEVRARLAADPTLLDRLGHARRIDMLHRALEARNHDGVRLIVELGVDINGMVPGTGHDRAVLHNAAAWHSLDTVRLLVDLGADPRLRDLTYHATPLGWALYNRNSSAVIDYLLQFATIFEAVRSGVVERVAALLAADPSLAGARDREGDPLVCSLNPESPTLGEMVRLLAERGVDLDARDTAGRALADRADAVGLTAFASVLREHAGH